LRPPWASGGAVIASVVVVVLVALASGYGYHRDEL
jgi:hypothetical protein